MKRIFFLVILLMAVVSGVSAQKGQSAVGVNLGAAPCLESGASLTNFEIGAKYQYGITDAIRLEADLSYGFKSKGIDVFEISANAHYLFNIGEKIQVYPLVGIGYGHIPSVNKFLFNVGAGAEYALTSKLSVGLELKYQYMSHFSRLPITVGVTYKF